MASYVRAMLPRLAQRAGMEKRVHPHGLRHTHAAELAQERFPVNLIQQQLGHANLSVSSRYLDHIAPQERVEALKAREWGVQVVALAVEVIHGTRQAGATGRADRQGIGTKGQGPPPCEPAPEGR